MGNALRCPTGEEALRGRSLAGTVAIVTGASDGIGKELSRTLALAGARVIMACKGRRKGLLAAQEIRSDWRMEGREGFVDMQKCNLASLASVRQFAAYVLARYQNIHFLVLNAAVMACPLWLTREGYEMQLGVNYLGHFHLVQLLLPRMRAQEFESRILVVVCRMPVFSAAAAAALDLSDPAWALRPYDAFAAYGASKLACLLFASELAHRLRGSSVVVLAAHPGAAASGLTRFLGPLHALWHAAAKPWLCSLPQACFTLVQALVAPELRSRSGAYLARGRVARNSPHVRPAATAALWAATESLLSRAVLNCHTSSLNPGSVILQRLNCTVLQPLLAMLRLSWPGSSGSGSGLLAAGPKPQGSGLQSHSDSEE